MVALADSKLSRADESVFRANKAACSGTWNRGVRQVSLQFDKDGAMHVETWVRMQWGSNHPQIITRVDLNSTYGADVYPTTNGGYHPY